MDAGREPAPQGEEFDPWIELPSSSSIARVAALRSPGCRGCSALGSSQFRPLRNRNMRQTARNDQPCADLSSFAGYGCRARTCASTRGVRRSRRTPKQLERSESCQPWMQKDWTSMPASKSKQLERSKSCQLWMQRENLRPNDRSSILGSDSQGTRASRELPAMNAEREPAPQR